MQEKLYFLAFICIFVFHYYYVVGIYDDHVVVVGSRLLGSAVAVCS